MLKIEFNNQDKSPIRKSLLEKIAEETIARSGIFSSNKKNIAISFANVSEKEIKKLNKSYRNKNAPTDVLTFAEFTLLNTLSRGIFAFGGEFNRVNETNIFLGEIILCYNNIAKYSKKNKLNLEREFSKVVSHGVLHLLGFRHGKKMFEIQNH